MSIGIPTMGTEDGTMAESLILEFIDEELTHDYHFWKTHIKNRKLPPIAPASQITPMFLPVEHN